LFLLRLLANCEAIAIVDKLLFEQQPVLDALELEQAQVAF
jgi:hypothetical protein